MPTADEAFRPNRRAPRPDSITPTDTVDASAAFLSPGDASSAFQRPETLTPAQAEQRGYEAGARAVSQRMLPAHRTEPEARGAYAATGRFVRQARRLFEPSPVERPSVGGLARNFLLDVPGALLSAAETVTAPFPGSLSPSEDPLRRPKEFATSAIEMFRRGAEPTMRAVSQDLRTGGTAARAELVTRAITRAARGAGPQAAKFAYEHPVQTALAALLPLRAGAQAVARGAAARVGAEAELLPTPERIARVVSRGATEARPKPDMQIPRLPAGALTPEEAAVEARFAASVEADPDAYVAAYRKRFGNVVDPDNVRELSADYSASVAARGQFGTATHETASALSKLIYRRAVSEPAAPGGSNRVLLTAGGTGSGKTTATQALRDQAQVTFDGSLSNYKSAKALIDEALRHGKQVDLAYVYRDPLVSYMNGVLKRAPRIGRLTPLEFHARTHADAPKNILRIAKEYADNPNVFVRVIDNTGTTPIETSVDFLAGKQNLTERGIYDQIRAVIEEEHAAGRLPAEQYRRAISGGPGGQAPAVVGDRPDAGPGRATRGEPGGLQAAAGPPAVRTRVNQVHPDNAETLRKIEESPDFQERLASLGGGEVIGHERTLIEALKRPPMTLDELAAARAEAPVDVARAGLLRSRLWHEYQTAGERGDFQAQARAHELLERVEPGYQNLTGNPARALEFQKVLQFNNGLWQKARDLRAAGVPQEEATRQLNAEIARASRELGMEKLGKGWGSAIDRVLNYTVAAKLTSPVTHAVNFISNTMTAAQRTAEQIVGSGYALAGLQDPALAQSMFRGAFPTMQGFRTGVKAFIDEFGPEQASAAKLKFDLALPDGARRVYPLPMRLLNPFRWLGAADGLWKGIASHQTLTSLAYETALRENALRVQNGAQPLRGQAFAARIKGLIDDAPQAWRDKALAAAEEYTFQDDPGPTVTAISRAVRNIPLLGRLTVPFVRTPANVARFYGRRTPIGALASKQIRGQLAAGGRERAEAIGKLGVGTALQVEAFNAAQRGDITGAPSSDPNRRALDQARGIKPYTIKVGPVRLNYGRFSPQGLYLAQVAEIHRALAAGRTQEAQKLWESALFRLIQGLKEQTFLSGVSDAFDAMGDPERYFQRFKQGLVTGALFPNVLRDVAIQMDPYVHQPRTVTEAVQAMLPYFSQTLQPRLDIFGRPLLYPTSRLARGTKVISEDRSNRATEILRAAGYSPTVPKPVVTGGGRSIDLAEGGWGAQATLFQFELGHATEAAILRESAKRAFQAAPPERQARGLKKAVTEARNQVRDRWAMRYRDALRSAPRTTPGGIEE